MKSETIETFLESLGMESSLDVFNKQDIDLDLLMDIPEDDLSEVLMSLELTTSEIKRITRRIQQQKQQQQEPVGVCGISRVLGGHDLEFFSSNFNFPISTFSMLYKCISNGQSSF